ncbi:MAG TPA: siderophore-interacting protein [Gryllotalpicola sp.]
MLTLPAATERLRDERPSYRPFRVTVKAVTTLSPSFLRVTFTGEELEDFGTAGLDQRIKIVLPLEGDGAPAGFDHLRICDPLVVADGSWYELWRQTPETLRNPFRTYTVRGIRPQDRELDVDFAVHGDGGPASRWVRAARPGDEVVIVGPDDRSTGWRVGLDWHPGSSRELLLVGDETAVPAVCAILESLSPEVRATAFLEVPDPADRLELGLDDDTRHRVTWLPRIADQRGARLIAHVRDWAEQNRGVVTPQALAAHPVGFPVELDESDARDGILWDSPGAPDPAPATELGRNDFYAWIAGETQTVVTLRRHLVKELGVDRRRVAFMGYWRHGRAELS